MYDTLNSSSDTDTNNSFINSTDFHFIYSEN